MPIVSLFSENGGEFIKLKSFLANNGISHLTTPPHTPEVNGTAERKHKHVVEIGHSLLHHANLPPQLWSFAFTTATYLINRMPKPIHHMQSSFEVLFNIKPDYNKLHSFGCLCFPWLKPYTKNKLQPRSKPCIFLGYSMSQHAYFCLEPLSNRIYVSRHVNFVENSFPYESIIKPSPSSLIPTTDSEIHSIIHVPNKCSESSQHSESSESSMANAPNQSSAPEVHIHESVLPVQPSGSESSPVSVSELPVPMSNLLAGSITNNTSDHVPNSQCNKPASRDPIVTRSHHNIFKPKKIFSATKHDLQENLEPSTITQALKIAHRRDACSAEFNALMNNGTWTLVPRQTHTNLVGCKWLF